MYLNPHPSPMSEALAGVVVFGDEVRRFSANQAAGHPYMWKVALWGTPRDLTLIDDLCERFPSLERVAQSRRWQIRAGLIVKGRGVRHVPELGAMRYVPVDSVRPFHVTSSPEERIDSEDFHRPRNIEIYRGPHVLIRRGVMTGGVLASVFMRDDAVFTNGIFSIAGPPEDTENLKIVCAYINSSLARYYQFLTASQWGVERDEILLTEHKSLPCAIPVADTGLSRRIVDLVDRIQESSGGWHWQSELDEFVYEAYGVTSHEQQTIEDFLRMAMGRHYNGSGSNAFEAPTTVELTSYAQAFADVFEATTGGNRALVPTVYEGTPPYRAISFRLAPGDAPRRHQNTASEPELDSLLVNMERIVTEQHAQSLYFRRNIKVYEADMFHIVKPAERRFWTRSAAYNDADETIVELLRSLSPGSNGGAAHSI